MISIETLDFIDSINDAPQHMPASLDSDSQSVDITDWFSLSIDIDAV